MKETIAVTFEDGPLARKRACFETDQWPPLECIQVEFNEQDLEYVLTSYSDSDTRNPNAVREAVYRYSREIAPSL